jgi:hypothetical protein
MNHHPCKNLSLCLLYGCSHQEFSDISRSFLFSTVRHTSPAVFSGHNLATRKAAPILFVDQIEIHTPISSAELRVAKWPTGNNVSYCLFESCSHRRKSRVFTSFPIPYHRIHVPSCFFWSHIGHILVTWTLESC